MTDRTPPAEHSVIANQGYRTPLVGMFLARLWTGLAQYGSKPGSNLADLLPDSQPGVVYSYPWLAVCLWSPWGVGLALLSATDVR